MSARDKPLNGSKILSEHSEVDRRSFKVIKRMVWPPASNRGHVQD